MSGRSRAARKVLEADPGQQPGGRAPSRRRHDPRGADRRGQGGTNPRRLERLGPREDREPQRQPHRCSMLGSMTRAPPSSPSTHLMTHTTGLDGGGTVAADVDGHVFVAWHGRHQGRPRGGGGRGDSLSPGPRTMARPSPPSSPPSTAPPGPAAAAGRVPSSTVAAHLFALYRAATENIGRDMIVIASPGPRHHFEGKSLHPWRINLCPMSSEAFAEGPAGVLAGWETNGHVYFAKVDPGTLGSTPPVEPPGRAGTRKHPAPRGQPARRDDPRLDRGHRLAAGRGVGLAGLRRRGQADRREGPHPEGDPRLGPGDRRRSGRWAASRSSTDRRMRFGVR